MLIGQMRFSLSEYTPRTPLTTVLQGEVDIVEGVNDQPPNQSTLHTSASK